VAPPPAPTPPAPPGRTWEITALGGIDATALPLAAWGLGIAVGIVFGRNRFELRASAWLPRTATVSAASGVDVGLYAGAARYCRGLVDRRVELGACAAFEAGALRAAAFGLRRNGSGLGRWLAPELGLVGIAHLAPHFAISLEAGALVPIVREHFLIDTTLTFRPGPVDGRGLLGVRLDGL
jgi:hypothetical protein